MTGAGLAVSDARRRSILALLTTTVFVTITYEVSPVGLLSVIATALRTDEQGAGLLVGSYAAVVALGSIPLSALVARFDARTSLLVLLATLTASSGFFAAAPTLGVAVVARLVGGAAHAVIFTTVYRLALAVVPVERRGRTAGTVALGNGVALVVGVPLATAVGAATSWRVPFVALAVAYVVVGVVVVLVVPRRLGSAGPDASGAGLLRGVSSPALLRVGLTTLVLVAGHFVTFTYVQPILLAAGVSRDGVGAVLLAYGVAGVVALLVVTPLSDHRPRLVTGLAMVLLLLALLGLRLGLGATGPTVAAVVVWGLAFGAVPVLTQVLAIRATPATPAAAAPMINTSFNLGAALGSALGGVVLTARGPDALVVVSLVLVGVVTVVSLLTSRER